MDLGKASSMVSRKGVGKGLCMGLSIDSGNGLGTGIQAM